MRKILLVLLTMISHVSFAQSLERVRSYLDTLCSPGMYGRGATHNGDSIAAAYLRNQFTQIGLKPISKNYYQYFFYNVNTFPGDCELKIGKSKLDTGKDFIVNSFSGSGKGKGKLVVLDTMIFHSENARQAFLKVDLRKKIIIYNGKDKSRLVDLPVEFIQKIHEAKCVIELEDKLTAGVSAEQYSNPFFKLQRSCFQGKEKKCKYKLDAVLLKNHRSQNVIGFIEGKLKPDSFIVISAHYDHLGTMGKNAYFPGANDNASGVSMLLELARYYKEHTPDYSVVFMAFGAEEAGLIGSRYYVEHPIFPLSEIRFLINLDLLGTGDDGITVVNATVFPEYFNKLNLINKENAYVKEIRKRGAAANSDHFFFTEAGVPSFFIYTLGGIAAYHDVYDLPQTLPLTDFVDVFKLLTGFVKELE